MLQKCEYGTVPGARYSGPQALQARFVALCIINQCDSVAWMQRFSDLVRWKSEISKYMRGKNETLATNYY